MKKNKILKPALTVEEIAEKGNKETQVLFCVRDRVADEFSEPKMFANKALGVRWFNDLMHKTSFPADDFERLVVGEFDVERGVVTGYEKPEFVQRGMSEV